MKEFKYNIWNTFLIVLLSLWLILYILVKPFYISWSSMNDTYEDKDFVLIEEYSYLDLFWMKQWKVNREDVIIFKTIFEGEKTYLIKRVIWLPWETLKIENGKVFIKEVWKEEFIKLDEEYLNEYNKNNTKIVDSLDEIIFYIPKWEYFVMWDNRNNSADSRTCFDLYCDLVDEDNFINKDEINWRVFLNFGDF